MSRLIFIVGDSGTGKSYSLKTLDPQSSFVINCVGKDMPWRKWSDTWSREKKNHSVTTNWETIVKTMLWIDKKAPHIKNIVIDDFQYVMSFEYLQHLEKDVWETFRNIGGHVFQIVNTARSLRRDLNIIILTHSETQPETGRRKVKTVGKMTDEKITLEGLATIVLFTSVEPNPETGQVQYLFETQNDGSTTAKSPEGMFKTKKVPNDLGQVVKTITEYF